MSANSDETGGAHVTVERRLSVGLRLSILNSSWRQLNDSGRFGRVTKARVNAALKLYESGSTPDDAFTRFVFDLCAAAPALEERVFEEMKAELLEDQDRISDPSDLPTSQRRHTTPPHVAGESSSPASLWGGRLLWLVILAALIGALGWWGLVVGIVARLTWFAVDIGLLVRRGK